MTPARPGWLTDDEYAFIYARVPRICADAVILDPRGRVLLTWRTIAPWKDLWQLPGGGVRLGESLEAALTRIVAEEVGLRVVEPPRLLGAIEFIEDGRPHVVSAVHRVVVADGAPRASWQGADPTWFETIPADTVAQQRRFLDDAIRAGRLRP